eukprot:1372999-Rhodomonas_salina.2
MSGVVRRNTGAASQPEDEQNEGANPNGENGSGIQRPRVPRKQSRLRLLLAAGFAIVSTILVSSIPLSYVLNPQIHSCSGYLPAKAEAISATIQSLVMYAEEEGVLMLFKDIFAIVRSEILGLAPMPELIKRVSGKHLLMIGGARTWIALQRARQLGVRLTLVDDPAMRAEVGPFVHSFVAVENFSLVSVLEHEKVWHAIKSYQKDTATPLDGVFTLMEEHGPLVSFLASQLELPGSVAAIVLVARFVMSF